MSDSLSGQKVKDTFGRLLQIANANDGADGDLRIVRDGKGDATPLLLSTTLVRVDSNLEVTGEVSIDGVLTAPGYTGRITSAAVNGSGRLIIATADGVQFDAGAVVGPAGPTGPLSVVGAPLGTWDADANSPTLGDGSGTQGDSYVVSVAGTTGLDGESGWQVGDIAVRGASIWARVPGSSGVGLFTQITIGDTVTTEDGVAGGGLVFVDPYGEVIMSITGDEISMPGLVVGATGPVFDELTVSEATATSATVAALTATGADIAEVTFVSGDGGDGLVLTDGFGEVLMQIDGAGVAMPGAAVAQNGGTVGLEFADPYGEVAFRIGTTGAAEFGGLMFQAPGEGPFALAFADTYGEIFAGFDDEGLAQGFGAGSGTGSQSTSHSEIEIAARNGINYGDAASMPIKQVTDIARLIWKYNHVIVYGQSLAQGAEGAPTISRTAKYGNLMVGEKTTSVNNSMPGANNATPPTYEITGSSVFEDLEATDGVSAETVLHGALNTFRRLWLAHFGLPSDTTRLLVGSGAAVGGQAIAALSKGAAPNLYNRLPSLINQTAAIAATASGTYGVGALLWLQGESNQTTTSAVYLPLLRQFYADFCADTIAETSQVDPPAMFTYQTTAANNNFDTAGLGVQMAQLTMALEDAGVFMIGPSYPYPDSNNLHLVANGYRWMGSQFGKVMHRVLTLGHDWKPLHMRKATVRGREILVDCFVPHPPLVFDDPYLQTGWTVGSVTTGGANSGYAQDDKGFRVISTTGINAAIESVVLASETQVLITLTDAPSLSLTWLVRVADGAHKGHANVRDSDPTLADDIYLDGQAGQVDGEANATLSGERYPLWNWIVSQQIAVEIPE
jgi:hypothetical protein